MRLRIRTARAGQPAQAMAAGQGQPASAAGVPGQPVDVPGQPPVTPATPGAGPGPQVPGPPVDPASPAVGPAAVDPGGSRAAVSPAGGQPAPAPPSGDVPQQTVAPAPAAVPAPPPHVVRRTRAGGVWVGLALSAIVLLLLLVFILENGQQADIGYFGAHGHLPLGVALLLAAVAGALLVVIPGTARIIQLRRTARRHRALDAQARTASAQRGGPSAGAPPGSPAGPA